MATSLHMDENGHATMMRNVIVAHFYSVYEPRNRSSGITHFTSMCGAKRVPLSELIKRPLSERLLSDVLARTGTVKCPKCQDVFWH